MKIDNIEQYLPLIKKISLNYKNLPIPQEDLIQEGYIGIMEAAKRYDSNKGAKFTTYATYWIKKKILDALEKENISTTTALKNKKNVKEERIQSTGKDLINFPDDFPKIEKRILRLLYEDNLTLKEISKKLKIDREKVRRLKELGKRRIKKYYQKQDTKDNYFSIFPDNIT